MNKLWIIVIISLLIIFTWTFIFRDEIMFNQIKEEQAKNLIIENFWKCSDDCEKLDISIWVNNNKNMIIWEYLWLKDDSIKSKKETLIIEKTNWKWNVIEKLETQFICYEWRWQQDYSNEFCK